MSVVPIRPVFQDGQRLTAERLTQALEFLRTMLRRVLLAPLSSGVAGGFELSPTGGVTGDTLSIAPGLAIDGQGRLIVVPEGLTFSLTDITSGASITPTAGTVVRICLAQRESAEADACSPLKALGVEEGFEVLFKEQEIDEALFEVVSSFTEPNSVAAWGDLDPPFATPEDSCVTLGHIIFADAFTFSSTAFFRDGVSPRFKAIRNTAGTPSIFLNELNIPGGAFNPPGKFPGVAIPLTTLLGPNPVIVQPGAGLAVYAPAYFKDLVGESVQATHVSVYGTNIQAGRASPGNATVFEFSGGAGTVGFGRAGLSAVPVEFDEVYGPVPSAGVPLLLADSDAGDPLKVSRLPSGATYDIAKLAGLSASGSYVDPTNGTLSISLAMSGIVELSVDSSAGVIAQGSQLTAGELGSEVLVPHGTPGTGRPLARLAQRVPMSPTPTNALAWALT